MSLTVTSAKIWRGCRQVFVFVVQCSVHVVCSEYLQILTDDQRQFSRPLPLVSLAILWTHHLANYKSFVHLGGWKETRESEERVLRPRHFPCPHCGQTDIHKYLLKKKNNKFCTCNLRIGWSSHEFSLSAKVIVPVSLIIFSLLYWGFGLAHYYS